MTGVGGHGGVVRTPRAVADATPGESLPALLYGAPQGCDGGGRTATADWHHRCDDGPVSEPQPYPSALSHALPAIAREVEEFVAAAGWDQQPQLFALVATATLLASQPELADHLDGQTSLTPVAQDALPEGELDAALAAIEWPESVAGCALAQEIVVLPPAAEAGLGELPADPAQARRAAARHPQRREGRLVAAVLRDGVGACVLRLRATPGKANTGETNTGETNTGDEQDRDEVVEDPQLAPNLLRALLATLR